MPGMNQPRPQMSQNANQMGMERPVPHFVRKKTNEEIIVASDEFKLGRSKAHADYALENNTAISRVHCIVVRKNGVSYIKDNNSSNGTYVNGKKLAPGEEVLLKNKTEIKLGDEELVFYLRKGE